MGKHLKVAGKITKHADTWVWALGGKMIV